MLKHLQTFDLIYELMRDGKADLHPNLEPINPDSIIKALASRTGLNFKDDVELWIRWFLSPECDSKDEDKSKIRTIKKILDIEQRAMRKLREEE